VHEETRRSEETESLSVLRTIHGTSLPLNWQVGRIYFYWSRIVYHVFWIRFFSIILWTGQAYHNFRPYKCVHYSQCSVSGSMKHRCIDYDMDKKNSDGYSTTGWPERGRKLGRLSVILSHANRSCTAGGASFQCPAAETDMKSMQRELLEKTFNFFVVHHSLLMMKELYYYYC
jgi:hypothetical protein